jgi:hypothetical protein
MAAGQRTRASRTATPGRANVERTSVVSAGRTVAADKESAARMENAAPKGIAADSVAVVAAVAV